MYYLEPGGYHSTSSRNPCRVVAFLPGLLPRVPLTVNPTNVARIHKQFENHVAISPRFGSGGRHIDSVAEHRVGTSGYAETLLPNNGRSRVWVCSVEHDESLLPEPADRRLPPDGNITEARHFDGFLVKKVLH